MHNVLMHTYKLKKKNTINNGQKINKQYCRFKSSNG